MPERQDNSVLFEESNLRIIDLRCRIRGCTYREVVNGANVIALVRAGCYVCKHAADELIADTNHVHFYNRCEVYPTSHPVSGGDNTTVIELSDDLITEVLRESDPWVQDHPYAPFGVLHSRVDRSSFRLHMALLRRARRRDKPLIVHESAFELVEALCIGVCEPPEPTRRPYAAAKHKELARDVVLLLNETWADPPKLADLAASLYTSPYHLSRVFRRQTGLSIHQYLLQLRVRTAAEWLVEGNSDLAELAQSLGFADHSHFTNTFRRIHGMTPSAFRDAMASSARSIDLALDPFPRAYPGST